MGATGQSITLANGIIGVGILAMPFCYQQCGIILATLILLLMGLVSRLSCHFLLKSALIARRRNFEFLAFHVFGPAGKLVVEIGIIGFLMGTCIAYFVVVGDLGPQIVSKMFNINQSDILRTSIMVIVSLVCVLPLGLLRNVDSLSNVSAATIGFYFCLVIKLISEAASQVFSPDWHTKVELWKPAGVLQCVPIFSMALFCQTQLFEIFESVPLSLEKMNCITKNAINICTAVYFTLGLFGYIAFCSHSISGNVLMSLAPTMTNDVIKLGFVMSVAFSFPLIIFPCRASLYSFLYKKVHSSHHDHIINNSIPIARFRCITIAIIATALVVSLLIPNIELVLGLVGSTIGVLVCVVFPAACFINVTFKDTNERLLAKVIIVLGLIILVLGTYANLQAAENQVDKYDEKHITQEKIDKIVEDFFEAKRQEKHIGAPPQIINKPIQTRQNGATLNKDSEVQPPNPVPPEPVIIKRKENIVLKNNDFKKISKEANSMLSKETTPKKQSEINKPNISKPEVIKERVDVAEKKEDKYNSKENLQENIDLIKQQKLIETIKQHGKEQKELIKEQKEILQEIEEIKQKDIVDDTNKIAVESIKKIAKVAIKSLSNPSEKPSLDKPEDKPLNKIANEAVQEIAKKAVESIVAIQDKVKDEVVEKNLGKTDKKSTVNIINPVKDTVNLEINNKPVLSAQGHIDKTVEKEDKNNVQPEPVPLSISEYIIPRPKKEVQGVKPVPVVDKINDPVAVNAKMQTNIKDNTNQVPESVIKVNPAVIVQEGHSHSPDEPQSYKEGEDSQVNLNKKAINAQSNLKPDVPLAVALNKNTLKKGVATDNKKTEDLVKTILDNNLNVPVVETKVEHRRKREVIDCSDKLVSVQDRQICNSLQPKKIASEKPDEILSNINLNDVIANRLLIDNAIHRSLKSFDESERSS